MSRFHLPSLSKDVIITITKKQNQRTKGKVIINCARKTRKGQVYIAMKRSKLEQYLGKTVTVMLFDGDIYTGTLQKTGTEELKNKNYTLYLTQNRYYIETDGQLSPCFCCSHVTKLKE